MTKQLLPHIYRVVQNSEAMCSTV